MSLALPIQRPANAQLLARPASAVVIVWLLATVIVTQQVLPGLIARGSADPDVLARLVEVRDFLAGQSWFDVTQYRLGVPDGVPMHWSRLVDVPLAVLVALFSLVLPREGAEIAMMTAWPALLSLGLIAGVASIAVRLAGREAAWPGALMALFAIHIRYLFSPGNIDHHNLQLVLSLAALAALVRLERGAVPGALAGAALALMLAVGMETLPLVALFAGAALLALIFQPARFARGAAAFGLTLGLVTPALYLATLPTGRATLFLCDALSPPYLAAAIVGGGGLALLAALAPRLPGLGGRLAAGAALGALAAGAAVALGPRCIAGPYAEIDPELARRWLSSVDEAKSWFTLLGDDFAKAIAIIGAPLVALGVTLAALRRAAPEDRFAFALVLAAGAVTTAIMLAQIRGAAFASAFALAPGAALIASVRHRLAGRSDAAAQLLLVLAWLAPQSLVYHGIGQGLQALRIAPPAASPVALSEAGAADPAQPSPCFDRTAFAALAALPPGRVLAPSNLGPAIIAHTPHGALAGPYHRDAAGILASFAAFDGAPAEARAIARQRGLNLVAVCVGDSAFAASVLNHPAGFAAALMRGPLPDWLEPVALGPALRIYRVRD